MFLPLLTLNVLEFCTESYRVQLLNISNAPTKYEIRSTLNAAENVVAIKRHTHIYTYTHAIGIT